MKATIKFALILWILATISDLAPNAFASEIVKQTGGYGYACVTHISLRQLEESPSWEQSAENPPLSPKQAMSIATNFVQTSALRTTRWTPEKIILNPASSDKWYYTVQFVFAGKEDQLVSYGSGKRMRFEIDILMSGVVATTITAELEPTKK